MTSSNPLGSVYTANFPDLLRRQRCSLLATTFQANKLIVVRPQAADLNTHFHTIPRPMGLAADINRIFIGSRNAVHEFRNVPAVASKLPRPHAYDAVYLPRNTHVTGHVDIHEMAFSGEQCWYVNTLFSCLCTLDNEHSFVPRWRPRFISGYAPEDRCHLNGLAMLDGRPKYLTALGAGNHRQGWRENKRNGGILLDYDSGEIVARGLSMPHSPRLHDGRLWLLESGRGSLVTIDPANGKANTVISLPGFTRGLDFAGRLAFIGLSRLRASNPFTDIPITDQNPERASGIWVVDTLSARTVAFLRFSDAVEEIFAVQALPGLLQPHLLDETDPLIDSTWSIPDHLLHEVEEPARPREGVSAADADQTLFEGLRLTNVYQRISDEQAEEVVRLWLGAGVATQEEARKRCREVVFLVHNADNELIGVDSAYVAEFIPGWQPSYFLRMFIRPADRGNLAMLRHVLLSTFDFLAHHPDPRHPAGLVLVTENEKLMRPGIRKRLDGMGFTRLGSDPRGRDVRYRSFDGAAADHSQPP